MSSAPTSSLLSPCCEFFSIDGIGTNDTELAADDADVVGTIITRRVSPTAGARGGAGA